MGIALPQLAPASEDRVSGALVIDGSLKFDGRSGGNHGYGHLKRTSSGASGSGTFTISWWAKRGSMRDDWQYMIAGDNGSLWGVGFAGSSGQRDSLTLFNGSHQFSSARFRDNSGWYHIVLSVDSDDGPRLWVNGELQSNANTNTSWNLNNTMYIGKWVDSGTAHNYDGYLAQYTCIDGLELGPSYFAYTDPLTGVWRPKKFVAEGTTVNDGTVWSNSSADPNNVKASGDASQLFNGNLSAGGVSLNKTTTSSNNWYEALTGVSIPCNNSVAFYSANGASTATMRINGDDNLKVEAQTTTNGWWALNFEGTITKIELAYLDGSGSSNTYYGIQIDGVTLIDSTTQNLAFGNAGFYLPLDGNTPIGQDLSGNGNNWTPEGFGGSNSIEKATGAFPILNTGNGGTIARPGVFGSEVSKSYTILGTSGGGNPYVFEDLGNQPQLSFIRGATYTFDWSAASSHPLRFATAADAAGSTEYTDGTNVTGNVTTITVPHNAPDTLYYYCNVHGGMGNSISVTTDETKADPYAWKCVLAVPFAGSANDVSATINCTTSNHTATVSGSVARSAQSNFYNGSFFFDGSNDTVSYAHSEDFHIGASDFTVEGWVWKDNKGSRQSWIGQRDGGSTEWRILFDYLANPDADSEGAVRMEWGSSQLVFTSNALMHSQWNHVAMVRSGTTGTLYINGISIGTQTLNDIGDYAADLYIGQQINTGGENYQGYMNDIRIYKGVAKYTSSTIGEQAFIPASTSPDVLPDTPSGVATKSKLTKITDGAVSIRRSSDQYLQAPASTDFRLDGQYCIEYFLNLTDYSNDSVYVRTFILDGPTGDGGSTNIHLNVNPSTGVLLFWSGSSELISGTISIAGGWHHVCLTRDSSNKTRLFIDGVLSGSADITTDYNLNSNQNRPRLGALGTTGGTSGYYSNWRIIKGSIPTEYQTSTTTNGTRAFYPPTSALTNVTNTKLLTCQSNVTSGAAAVSPSISGINDGTVWSHQNSFVIAVAGTTETGSLAAVFNPTTGVTGAADSFGFLNGAFDFTYTPDAPIPYSSKVRVWTGFGGSVYLNNGSAVSAQNNNWTTLATGSSGTITSIRFTASGSGGWWSGLEVDDVMLVDPVNTNGNAAATNFNPFNTDINTVRGQEGSYCTWNPLTKTGGTLSNGNLKFIGSSAWQAVKGTFSVSSGKWYYEATTFGNTYGTAKGNVSFGIGWYKTKENASTNNVDTASHYVNLVAFSNNGWWNNFGAMQSSVTSTTEGDVIGVALDKDNNTFEFYKNGISVISGTLSNTTDDLSPWNNCYYTNSFYECNFGQKPFKFPPPDGFQPLTSSTVRPDTVIARPDQYVSVMTYSGTNNSGNINVTSTDTNFTPDFVWVKTRTGGSEHHAAYDSVRGANKRILPSSTNQETTTTANDLNAFIPGGFTMNGQNGHIYNNGYTHVAWMWKAGGAPTADNTQTSGAMTANSVSLDGVLQSAYTPAGSPSTYPKRMSIGTKQGFSIVKFVGTGNAATIPHGLSETPTFIIHKFATASSNWSIWTPHLSSSTRLTFTSNGTDSSGSFQNTNSNTFDVASGFNDNTVEMITYCWHDVPGMFKTGTYVNNASADGPYIELGFKPAIVLIKCTGNGTNWRIADNARNPYNNGTTTEWLKPSTSDTEVSERAVDFVSTGFKIRSTSGGDINQSSNAGNITYIYAAWAEAPSFNLYGATSNAR